MITGLDLVELQIRVAQGEKLPKQSEIKMEGHAVEARLYAEDPANDFLPSIGQINKFYFISYVPEGQLRVDNGVEFGDEISVFYDPMIAKVITHAKDRLTAIDALIYPLSSNPIWGVKLNDDFLYNLISTKEFRQFSIDTSFIEKNITRLCPKDNSHTHEAIALASAKIIEYKGPSLNRTSSSNGLAYSPWSERSGWRLNNKSSAIIPFYINGEVIKSELIYSDSHKLDFLIMDQLYSVKRQNTSAETNSLQALAFLEAWDSRVKHDFVELRRRGEKIKIQRYIAGNESNISSNSNALTAPMPGKIIAVKAKAGDAVKAGEPLIIMEAMKMEMTLEAPRDGVVAEVSAAVDALVSDGELLLALEEE